MYEYIIFYHIIIIFFKVEERRRPCRVVFYSLFMYSIFLHFIWLATGLRALCDVNKKGLHFLQNDRVRGLEIELKRGLYIYECNHREPLFELLLLFSKNEK
jgi:hypothetical protein